MIPIRLEICPWCLKKPLNSDGQIVINCNEEGISLKCPHCGAQGPVVKKYDEVAHHFDEDFRSDIVMSFWNNRQK